MNICNYDDPVSGHNTYVTLGASNHTIEDRSKDDFYATPPKAVYDILNIEKFDKNIWEPACGMNHIVNILEEKGYNVRRSDINNMVSTDDKFEQIDFLRCMKRWHGDIVTNPPFSLAVDFVNKSLELIDDGKKVAMFLKLQFLEGKKRYNNLFSEHPPKIIYVAVNRYGCTKDGVFNADGNFGSAICYCWFIWEKGYKGDPKIKWINQ